MTWFGYTVSNAGYINGDWINDTLIGASRASSYAGAAYVIFGKSSGFTDIKLSTTNVSATQQGFKICWSFTSYLGTSVSSTGDFDKDGYSDIVFRDLTCLSNTYILFGRDGGFTDVIINNTTYPNLNTASKSLMQ